MKNFLISGEWVASRSGRTRDVINPYDQSVVETVAEAAPEDVDAAVGAARGAFDEGGWARTPPAERGALLSRVADLLLRDKERIAETETLDTGKTLRESRIDVDDVASVFRYYAELVKEDPTRVVDAGTPEIRSRIVYEPVGVCALIAPWNYPLLQISWKVAPALAAGNAIVAKPSELTPLTTIRLFELLREAGLPPGVGNLVLGAGAEAGAAMVEHPLVDLVSFTGGLETGRRIMRAAAGDIKKIALELGGKNPNIVFADADFETAVDYALNAAFIHSGQVCSAGARLILQDETYDDFLAEVARRADRIRLGDGRDPAAEVGPMVSQAQLDKTERYVEAAIDEGARLLAGGRRPDEPALRNGFFYRPTVFAECDRDMTVIREETFAPILTAERFTTEHEAIRIGNDTEYGLAAGVWTGDDERGDRVAGALRHGTVWINDFHPYIPQAEWGGFGRSGIGRELGPTGLDEYREAKHVYRNTSPRPSGWFGE